MEERERLLAACVRYFKERKSFDALFAKLCEKYRSLGRFGGAVTLSGLEAEDWQQLGGFLQKDLSGRRNCTISASALEKALQNSRFSCLTWEEILQAYFGRELTTGKETKSRETRQRERYFSDILEQTAEGPCREWLQRTLQGHREEGHQLLMKHYREDADGLRRVLRQVLDAAIRLPFLTVTAGEAGERPGPIGVSESFSGRREKVLLAVFAAQQTGDPHFFDTGTLGEQLLCAFLRSVLPQAPRGRLYGAEEKAALFFAAGLLKDDLSNHVLTYGISGCTVDGSIHEGMEGFRIRREPLVLTLRTIGSLSGVTAQGSKRVYIVENPAVFSVLVNEWPEETLLCGNGQIRLATLVLLDLFDTDTIFWYAGDFDPEGLQIAQRLKQRYQDRLHLWNYQSRYYEASRSQVAISDQSLKKLDRIDIPELQEIKEALLREKSAAYQEAMLDVYLTEKP